jgi:NitT/TauT family transport system substrate-binding protein
MKRMICSRSAILGFAVLAVAAALAGPARAQPQEMKLGVGFGIGFLPLYIVEEQHLLETHAKEVGVELTTSYQRFSGSAAMQDAVLSGAVDMGGYGVPAVLIAWNRAKNTPNQVYAVSGITTLPLVLLTNRPEVKTLADIKESDRIAMPALVSPQMYVLQMAAAQQLGDSQVDRFKQQVVALPHPEALNSLVSGGTEITFYFSSAPFTELALRNSKIHQVLSSPDVFHGPSSFLVMAATKRYLEAHPHMDTVMAQSIGEAAALIKNDPHQAAQIYLRREPSKLLDLAAVEDILKRLSDNFGTDIQGVQATSDFMVKAAVIKSGVANWHDIVTPAIAGTKSS